MMVRTYWSIIMIEQQQDIGRMQLTAGEMMVVFEGIAVKSCNGMLAVLESVVREEFERG